MPLLVVMGPHDQAENARDMVQAMVTQLRDARSHGTRGGATNYGAGKRKHSWLPSTADGEGVASSSSSNSLTVGDAGRPQPSPQGGDGEEKAGGWQSHGATCSRRGGARGEFALGSTVARWGSMAGRKPRGILGW